MGLQGTAVAMSWAIYIQYRCRRFEHTHGIIGIGAVAPLTEHVQPNRCMSWSGMWYVCGTTMRTRAVHLSLWSVHIADLQYYVLHQFHYISPEGS